jgi:hypothetical protein
MLKFLASTLVIANLGPADLKLAAAVDVVDALCEAVAGAWSAWERAASLKQVVVKGAVANGGKLVGPRVGPLILSRGAGGRPGQKKSAAAVAHSLDEAMRTFQAGAEVPGLRWYPTFEAYAGPEAPPTSNQECPLTAIAHPGVFGTMAASTGDPAADAVLEAVRLAAPMWVSNKTVKNVLGSGPVPTWTPPLIPVGPVEGSAVGAPGFLV